MIAMNNLENLATAIGTDIKDIKTQTTNSQAKISANTEAIDRIDTQMNNLATKSEVEQGINSLTKTFAKMKVGSRNYAEDYDFSRGLWNYSQGDNSPQDWTVSNGEYNVKGTTNTWKQFQIFSNEGTRYSLKSSTALLELELGETYTLSFQAMCHSGNPSVWVSLRANRTVPGNPEIIYGNFNLTSSWQTYQVTVPELAKPENFDFWRIILGYNEIGHVAFRKVELTRSSTRIDAGPAPEDGKTDLIAVKSNFEKTAEGLSAKFETFREQQFTREEFNSKDCITGSTEYQILKHQVESLVKQNQALQEQLALIKPAPRRAPMAYTIDRSTNKKIAWFDNGCGIDVGNNSDITLGYGQPYNITKQLGYIGFPNMIVKTSKGISTIEDWQMSADVSYWNDTVVVLNSLKNKNDYDWTNAVLNPKDPNPAKYGLYSKFQKNIIRIMYELGIWDAKTVESLGAVRR